MKENFILILTGFRLKVTCHCHSERLNFINFKEACAKRNNPEGSVNTGNPHHTNYFKNLNNTKKNKDENLPQKTLMFDKNYFNIYIQM